MRSDADRQTGYCTNVHAGTTLEQVQHNLAEHAVAVQQALQSDQALGVGLWIPAEAAGQLQSAEVRRLGEWLRQHRLNPFTINGFPYGNFHQPVVKHRVYEPTWWEASRRDYTLHLIEILDALLPEGRTGSISTLPIAWQDDLATDERLAAAAENLLQVGRALADLEARRGRYIALAIEPEPGCVLQRTADVLQFFDRFIQRGEMRRYLTICHDICHAAVMFESQSEVLHQLADAEVGIGKFQVSSAIEVRWATLDAQQRSDALVQLSQFAEDRYLHQTCRQSARKDSIVFVDDLPEITTDRSLCDEDAMWRIHFHMPIYLDRFGLLHTTQQEAADLLRSLDAVPNLRYVPHFEAETYAWNVLPAELQRSTLAAGIADEMRWLEGQLAQV